MNSDLVVHVSVYNQAYSSSFISTYSLSSFAPNENSTAFQQLKSEVMSKSQNLTVNWTSVSLVVNGFAVATIKGNLSWFAGIEFFWKYVNSGAGASMVDTPDSFGVIDQDRKIRVEFENHQIMITPS